MARAMKLVFMDIPLFLCNFWSKKTFAFVKNITFLTETLLTTSHKPQSPWKLSYILLYILISGCTIIAGRSILLVCVKDTSCITDESQTFVFKLKDR